MSVYNFVDQVGSVFGRLTVVDRAINRGGKTMWNCSCACGNSTTVRASHLNTGSVQSCGCIKQEQRTTHGKSRSPEYQCWQNMKDRCHKVSDPAFNNYGGRGITVCAEWMESFANFYWDMGDRPTSTHTIDRTDNESGYSASNCTWSTRKHQVCNRRNNILIEHDGKTQCLKDWCNELGIKYSTAMYHYKRGRDISVVLKL